MAAGGRDAVYSRAKTRGPCLVRSDSATRPYTGGHRIKLNFNRWLKNADTVARLSRRPFGSFAAVSAARISRPDFEGLIT